MALNPSGPISFGGSTVGQSINLELGNSATALASINSTEFRTLAGVPSGLISLSDFYGKSNIVTGQIAYTTPGTYSWVAPVGVTSVSVVAVGGGGGGTIHYAGGYGGGLGYKNNYTVVPGNSYTVVVGYGGYGGLSSGTRDGTDSYFVSTSVVKGGGGQMYVGSPIAGGTYTGDGGGNGGGGGYTGCGGAGGYSGNGGAYGTAGSGGGGGGGAQYIIGYGAGFGAGGGVGILGQGTSGAAGTFGSDVNLLAGRGGSGGGTASGSTFYNGGLYGGGAGNSATGSPYGEIDGSGGNGAVRIIYPGNTRSFPSTNTGNL